MKTCSKCKAEKQLEEFFVSRKSRSKDGKHNVCKQCCREYGKQWRSNNTSKSSIRRTDYKSKFGISLERYEEMLIEQSGQCAICKAVCSQSNKRLHVDHCHETGVVRGLLCHRCNLGLGLFMDKTDLLEKAKNYLESNHRL